MTDMQTLVSALMEATETGHLPWKRDDQSFHAQAEDVEINIWFEEELDMVILGMGQKGTPGCRIATWAVDALYDEVRRQVFCSNGPGDRLLAALKNPKKITRSKVKRANPDIADEE